MMETEKVDLEKIFESIFYMHCRKCMEEKPNDVTPQEWNKTETVVAPHEGIVIVVCRRHEIPVVTFSLTKEDAQRLGVTEDCECEVCKNKKTS